ncbi:MAG: tyrosine-type recombinase/integrase [Planctomycetota bacterium]
MTRRAQGSIFRRLRAGRPESRYTIQWTDENGRLRQKRSSSDKSIAERALQREIRRVERIDLEIADPDPTAKKATLATLVDDFEAALRGRDRTPKHVRHTCRRLRTVLKLMSAVVLRDLRLDRVERALGELMADGKSPKTRDHYAAATKQFAEWLVDVGHFAKNPLSKLKAVSRREVVMRERIALELPQVIALVDAAVKRSVDAYCDQHPNAEPELVEQLRFGGTSRGAIYALASMSGLRCKEIKALTWGSLGFGESPHVLVDARTSKTRQGATLPLLAWAVQVLTAYRLAWIAKNGRLPRHDEPVVRIPRHLPEQLRSDAKHAGIDVPAQRRLDLHALRTTYATNLARANVPVATAARLMRHDNISTTIAIYTKLGDADLRRGQQQLAQLLSPPVPPSASDGPTGAQAVAP